MKRLQHLNQEAKLLLLPTSGRAHIFSTITNQEEQNRNMPEPSIRLGDFICNGNCKYFIFSNLGLSLM